MRKRKNDFFSAENDPKTFSGKLFIIFVLLIILNIFVDKCTETYSGYDWYPGKGADEIRYLLDKNN